MFEDIGGKIKTLAVTLTWLGIVLSVLSGIVMLMDGAIDVLLIIIFGSLFSWLGSFLLYGFGQLVENSDTLVALMQDTTPPTAPDVTPRYRPLAGESHTGAAYHPSIDEPVYPPAMPADWICYACGNTNFHSVHTCQTCGVTKHWSDAKHAESSGAIGFK